MIYGLYLSASGVLSNSYRQDVIANNIANAETVGFKRDLALFQERLTEAQHRRFRGGSASGSGGEAQTNDLLEALGGGLFVSPTKIDASSGEMEPTGNNLDVAVEGDRGFFLVRDHDGTPRLTRNGSFMIDDGGRLILSSGQQVLDANRKPIVLDGARQAQTAITKDGLITQAGEPAARIGLFDVADPASLTKRGQMLLDHPDIDTLKLSTATLHAGAVERANVDPTTELALLMDAQRQLEANANMIRYQDATLGKLVNEVGKI